MKELKDEREEEEKKERRGRLLMCHRIWYAPLRIDRVHRIPCCGPSEFTHYIVYKGDTLQAPTVRYGDTQRIATSTLTMVARGNKIYLASRSTKKKEEYEK